MSENAIVTGGFSKAYGLPGLRLGWLVGPADFIATGWHHHDYTTIAAALPSQLAALGALREENRQRLLQRTRTLINANLPLVEAFVARHGDQFQFVPPQAGAMAFLRYQAKINSTELAELARKKHGLLIVAGDCYGMDGYTRLGIGGKREHFLEGLERLSKLVAEIA
jgi:aspartate/methionine/tyrosine aminotransferase